MCVRGEGGAGRRGRQGRAGQGRAGAKRIVGAEENMQHSIDMHSIPTCRKSIYTYIYIYSDRVSRLSTKGM